MADKFKSLNQTLGASNTNIYSCPANANAIITLAQIANIDGSNSADAYVFMTDNASGNTRALIFKVPVPAGAATTFLTGKLAMRPSDIISAKASAANSIDITISAIEIT